MAQSNPVIAEQKTAYTNNKNNLIKAAEKMPEEAYSFKPTPEMEAFGAAHGPHREPDRNVQRDDRRAKAESGGGEDGEGGYRCRAEGKFRGLRRRLGQHER